MDGPPDRPDSHEEALDVRPGSVAAGLDTARMHRLLDLGAGLVEEHDLDTLLDRIVDSGRELTGARYAALGVLDETRSSLKRFIAHGIDDETRRAIGDLPTGKGVLGYLIDVPEPLRLGDVGAHPQAAGFPADHPPMRTFLGVPIVIRGRPYGNLYLTEKAGGEEFDEGDERAAVVLAAWAAIAIDNAELIERERLRHSIRAAERERKRWARELHDDTLQSLGALRMLLSSALRSGDTDRVADTAEETIWKLADEIASLRSLIAELRPATLDELGLSAALESLIERHASSGFDLRPAIALRHGTGREQRLEPDTELTVYRVVQEALTNAAKHSRAELVELHVAEGADEIEVVISDDGVGFAVGSRIDAGGFGLAGMKERVALVSGSLELESAPGVGTTIRLRVPVVTLGGR